MYEMYEIKSNFGNKIYEILCKRKEPHLIDVWEFKC